MPNEITALLHKQYLYVGETGSTYPDITLLPALARLLKIDLNTLMSFNEDLSDVEIENFVNELDNTVQHKGYEYAFNAAMDKIHEYPTCDMLIYYAIFYLEGALILYNVSDTEKYQKVFEQFYKRLADSKTQEIRDTAVSMLISYARNNGDFSKAEELINMLPFSSIDKEKQMAILYRYQKKYEDAQKIWEKRILKSVTNIQTALINMLERSLEEKEHQEAEYFADLYETVTTLFCMPKWMCCNAHLQIAFEKRTEINVWIFFKKCCPI